MSVTPRDTLGAGSFIVAGTDITAAYAGNAISGPFQVGRCARLTCWVSIVLAPGSGITSVTVKLQTRRNNGTVQTTYIDLASDRGDKGTVSGTIEVEHAYTPLVAPIAAPGVPNRFFLDNPAGITDVLVAVKANTAGIAGDSVTVTMDLG